MFQVTLFNNMFLSSAERDIGINLSTAELFLFVLARKNYL